VPCVLNTEDANRREKLLEQSEKFGSNVRKKQRENLKLMA
jgi:hypothetical protein